MKFFIFLFFMELFLIFNTTPLMYATIYNHVEVVKFLLSQSNIDINNSDIFDPIFLIKFQIIRNYFVFFPNSIIIFIH